MLLCPINSTGLEKSKRWSTDRTDRTDFHGLLLTESVRSVASVKSVHLLKLVFPKRFYCGD